MVVAQNVGSHQNNEKVYSCECELTVKRLSFALAYSNNGLSSGMQRFKVNRSGGCSVVC